MTANVFVRCPVVQDLVISARRSRPIDEAKAFLHDDSGATMVEYAFMVMLIAIVCFAAVTSIGSKVNAVYNAVANDF